MNWLLQRKHFQLTVVVGFADNVLLPVLVHVLPCPVPQPRGHGELGMRKLARAEDAFRHDDAALAVEEDHAAVGGPAFVADQVLGPFGSGKLRVRKQVDRSLAGPAELPLACQAVRVSIATC